jgi:hypothetical protein
VAGAAADVEGIMNYTTTEQNNIMAAVAGAFVSLRDGSNSIADFNALSNAVNIGLVRSEKLDPGTEEVFKLAQRALLRADQHYGAMGLYVFTQLDLVDIAKGVTAYADLLKTSTERQMREAIQEAERRLSAGMHAKLPPLH